VFTKALENERAFEAKFDAWRRRGAVRTSAERRT